MSHIKYENKLWLGEKFSNWSSIGTKDYQRARVYDAERLFLRSSSASSLNHVFYIHSLLPKITEFGSFDIKSITISSKSIRPIAFPSNDYKIKIKVPYYASKGLILHELAHCIAPKGIKHGPLFCAIYLRLLEIEFGREVKDEMIESFKKHKVQYEPFTSQND
jgi:hypothetical protein